MKTLKKALSVVLALAMILGMTVVSSAATYTDAAQVTDKEAVEVMTAVGVFNGISGAFQPAANLTRAQAAKLITYLALGEDVAEALPAVGIFKDVDNSHWAAKYIAYLYNEGVVAGVGAGKFNPNGNVTGYEFGKMLLGVLGYDASIEGYTGSTWAINVIKQMRACSIVSTTTSAAAANALTREQAARYCVNALQADRVEYADAQKISVGNVQIATNATAKIPTGTTSGDTARLMYALYGNNLSKTPASSNDDAMNRPAVKWQYKTKAVGEYKSTAAYSFVVDRTDKTLAQLITLQNDTLSYTGSIASVNGGTKATVASTEVAFGDVVELYMTDTSTANAVTDVVITRYSQDKVTAAIQTKTTDGVDFVYVPGITTGYVETKYVVGYEGLAKNDIVYIYVAQNATVDTEDDVYYIAKAEKVSGKLTAYTSATSKNPTTFTVADAKYKVNGNIGAVAGLQRADKTVDAKYNVSYDFYLDANGYIIYGVQTEVATSDYVVVQAIGAIAGSGVAKTASVEARLVKMDGTTVVASVDKVVLYDAGTPVTYVTGTPTSPETSIFDGTNVVEAVSNTTNAAFFTYEIDADGNYELTEVVDNTTKKIAVGTMGAITIANKASRLENNVIVNEDTIFVIANATGKTTFTSYTGKTNVPDVLEANGAYVTKNGVAQYVYVSTYTNKTTGGDTVFFLTATSSSHDSALDGTTVYYYNTYKAVVNGEIVDVKVKADGQGSDSLSGGSDAVAEGLLAVPTYDKYGRIEKLAVASDYVVGPVVGYTYAGGTLVTGNHVYTDYVCTADTTLFYKDVNGTYVKSSFDAYDEDANDNIYVVRKSGTSSSANYGVVDYAFVKYVEDNTAKIAKIATEITTTDTDYKSAFNAEFETTPTTLWGDKDCFWFVLDYAPVANYDLYITAQVGATTEAALTASAVTLCSPSNTSDTNLSFKGVYFDLNNASQNYGGANWWDTTVNNEVVVFNVTLTKVNDPTVVYDTVQVIIPNGTPA